jgi:hypothetical protein
MSCKALMKMIMPTKYCFISSNNVETLSLEVVSMSNVSLSDSMLALSTFSALLVSFLPFSLSFAHNNSITVIPLSRNSINLDGTLTPQEWADAYQQNLTSAGVPTQYTVLYLKYDFSEQALEGAFDIPDETPSTIECKHDQISFQFCAW